MKDMTQIIMHKTSGEARVLTFEEYRAGVARASMISPAAGRGEHPWDRLGVGAFMVTNLSAHQHCYTCCTPPAHQQIRPRSSALPHSSVVVAEHRTPPSFPRPSQPLEIPHPDPDPFSFLVQHAEREKHKTAGLVAGETNPKRLQQCLQLTSRMRELELRRTRDKKQLATGMTRHRFSLGSPKCFHRCAGSIEINPSIHPSRSVHPTSLRAVLTFLSHPGVITPS